MRHLIFNSPVEELARHQGCLEIVDAWQLLLEQLLPDSPIDTAVELCCGAFPKAGLALQNLQAHVQMYYLDQSRLALQQCQSFLKNFPGHYASANFLQDEIENDSLKLQCDLLLGNHVFDDLLLRNFLSKNGAIIKNPYHSKEFFLKTVSKAILYYDGNVGDYLAVLCKSLDRLVKPGGYIVISEYASWYESTYRIDHWLPLRLELLQNVNIIFLQNGYLPISFSQNNQSMRFYVWKK